MIGRIGQYYSLMAVAICTNKNTQKISCRQLKKKKEKKKKNKNQRICSQNSRNKQKTRTIYKLNLKSKENQLHTC